MKPTTVAIEDLTINDYFQVLWKRKWQILIPTLFIAGALGILCLFLPKTWQVDAILQPSKFFIKTQQGQFEEVILVPPKQIVSQINEGAYRTFLAASFNLSLMSFPPLRAEIIPDTNLVKIYIKIKDPQRGLEILRTLYGLVKRDFDRKVDGEIRSTDMLISKNKSEIERTQTDIDALNVEKNRVRKEIVSAENKLKISEERIRSILEEKKDVKGRVEEIEKQQLSSLKEKSDSINTLGHLLYSNVVQQNLRYYNDLDESLSRERISQEDHQFKIKDKEEELKKLDIQIEKTRKEIEIIEKDNQILNEQKMRLDYVQLIKEPTSSPRPVSPKTSLTILLSLVLGCVVFGMLAFFMEYLKSRKATSPHAT